MSAPIIFSLIVVMSNGDVHYTSGFENLHMCQEARSMALYKKTVEDKRAEDDARAANAKEWQLKQMASENHPPLTYSGSISGTISMTGYSPPTINVAECVAKADKP